MKRILFQYKWYIAAAIVVGMLTMLFRPFALRIDAQMSVQAHHGVVVSRLWHSALLTCLDARPLGRSAAL